MVEGVAAEVCAYRGALTNTATLIRPSDTLRLIKRVCRGETGG